MSKTFREYDLNVFYEDLGLNDLDEYEVADVFTIQPSVYELHPDGRSTRVYLESFKLSLAETRVIAPDFPIEEFGEDFFITLDAFYKQSKALPGRVKQILDTLPPAYDVQIGFDEPELKWLNTLFV
jgi:hypothetical protein